ncbi:DUF2157 domain-containing protein [Dissulfurirhabdus thermomarina]|uniref:DUF2157 domain-containing protein n=1 Tax=Dissulfurirhabdus thermomarina TaxID=1765737 RepID=A0A6N9TMV2_DISTH|nr:DUF2157 domain-containing protein [Dissulfurirhabdus thermomarina]NDY42612.1 DUF2157 domain-containing protein [Dissulfurirhabdus thermomarina]NMX24069.1 DUF2157 domain-containing protein [Dissulfurirhabdus thermomarina]
MKFHKDDMEWAVSEGLISGEQAERLWHALEARAGDRPRFDLATVAAYLGALIVISAMVWFLTDAWERLGGWGIFAVAAVYGAAFAAAGHHLFFARGLRVPGGLLFTVAVSMTPLAVYGLERGLGVWPQGDPGPYHGFHVWAKGSWILMEAATAGVALAVLRRVRFPFLTAPLAFALWYMSMDLAPLLLGRAELTWNGRLWVSLWFGLGMLAAAFVVDRRTREDYAFWLYLFGLLAFWGGLSLMRSHSELAKLFYCLINLGLLVLSVVLDRRAFAVFGALGVFGYIGHLAHEVFEDSLLFPFALSLAGIAVIGFGVWYQRRRAEIEAAILRLVPEGIRRRLPTARPAPGNRRRPE